MKQSTQHLMRHLDQVINGLKTFPRAPDEDSSRDLRELLNRVVPLVWVETVDSKINSRLHRVLVELERVQEEPVMEALQNYTTFLDSHRLNNGAAHFSTWSQLVEHCQSARHLVKLNLSAVLGTLAGALQAEVNQESVWTVDRQQHLHMLSKWVLLLVQHLSHSMQELVWGTSTFDDAGQPSTNHKNMGIIIGSLLTVLLAKTVPKDCSLLAGLVVGFILNQCPRPQEAMEIFQRLLACRHGHSPQTDSMLQFGNVPVPIPECAATGYTLGHSCLSNGLLSCASNNLLCCEVNLLPAHRKETAACVLFGVISDMCQEGKLKFHVFKILALWFKTMARILPEMVKKHRCRYFSVDSDVRLKTLDIIWTHLDSPVEGVNECVIEVFQLLLDLQVDELNILKSSSEGLCKTLQDAEVSEPAAAKSVMHHEDIITAVPICEKLPPGSIAAAQTSEMQFGDSIAAVPSHLSQWSAEERESQTQHLLNRVMHMSWQAKGKYSLLAVLMGYVDTAKFLTDHHEVWGHMLDCMGTNYLCPVATQLYKAIVSSVSFGGNSGTLVWQTVCLPWVVTALLSELSLLRHYIIHQWLPWTLKVVPGSHDLLLASLQSQSGQDGVNVLHGQVAVVKVARNLQLLTALPEDILRPAVFHPDEDIRLNAFCVICVNPRKSEGLQPVEMSLLRDSLPLTMNSDSAPFRQQLQTYLRSGVVRVRDSALAVLRNASKQGGNCLEDIMSPIEFLDWLWELCMSNMHPGCSFQRVKTSLEWTLVILESLVHDPVRIQKKGGCPSGTEDLVKYAQNQGKWQFHTTDCTVRLLSCLLHGTDEVREMAASALRLHYPWPLPLTLSGPTPQSAMTGLLWTGLEMCNSPRARDCESGAVLSTLIFGRYIIPERLQIELSSPATSVDSLTVQQCSTQTDAALCFLQTLLGQVEWGLQQTRLDTLTAAKQAPAHGFILALRRCLSEGHTEVIRSPDRLQPILTKLLEIIGGIIDSVLCVLGGTVQETETAPSFQQMSLAIGDVIAGSAAVDDADGDDEEGDDDGCRDNTALSPQHQMIMTWCWLNVRECSILLGKLPGIPSVRDCLSVEDVQGIAATFMKILTKCRHRGAIEGCNQGFIQFCIAMLKSPVKQFYCIPGQLLQQVMDQVTKRSSSSVTRRSAGLPLIVQSIVASESKLRQTRLLSSAIDQLLEILSQPVPDDPDQRVDLPQIHAMHILKAIFRESSVAMEVLQYISVASIHAIQGFASPLWAIRNAATQLFGTLVTRMLGQQKTKADNLHTTTAPEFFAHHPELQRFLLEQILVAAGEQEQEQEQGARVRLHPSLFPVLSVLAKLGSGVASDEKQSLLEEFVCPVQRLAQSSIYAVRGLAAQALVPLVPQQKLVTFLVATVQGLPASRHQCHSHNKLHGQLLQLEKLVQCLTESDAQTEAMMACCKQLASKSWLLTPDNHCSLLCAKYLHVLVAMATKTGLEMSAGEAASQIHQHLKLGKHALSEMSAGEAASQIHQHLKLGKHALSEVLIGQDEADQEVTLWHLNSCRPSDLASCLHRSLTSDRVTVLLTCVQWLRGVVLDSSKREAIPWTELQEDILSLCRHSDWDVRCESLQLILDIYRHTGGMPASAAPYCQLVESWAECGVPDTRSGALSLAASAVFCRQCSELTPVQLDQWSGWLARYSEPSYTPLLRQHAAHALCIAGGSLWGHVLQAQSNVLSSQVISNLYQASMYLLVDEDAGTRIVAAAFVQQLPWQPTDAQFQAIHSGLALQILQGNMKRLLSSLPALAVELFNRMNPTGVLRDIIVEMTVKQEIEMMFEAQDINPYKEPVVLNRLISQCLCESNKEETNLIVDQSWFDVQQSQVMGRLQEACRLLQPLCSESHILNVSHNKRVFENLHALLMQGQVLGHWGQGQDHETFEKLCKMTSLHPGLKSAAQLCLYSS